jgi:hypothetical protein
MAEQIQSALVLLALLGVTAFLVWLVFFTGEGYQGIVQDLKSITKKRQDLYAVPVFDRSKIDLPRPKKPFPKAIDRPRSADGAEQLSAWAEELRQSIEEIREEANALAKAYKDLPPQFSELASKPPKRASSKLAKSPAKKAPVKKKAKPVKKTQVTKAKNTASKPTGRKRSVSK